jgi:hypothetical protein
LAAFTTQLKDTIKHRPEKAVSDDYLELYTNLIIVFSKRFNNMDEDSDF